MSFLVEHHLLALLSTTNTALEMIHLLPSTDTIIDLKEVIECQYDILNCIINQQHYGSRNLDSIIKTCGNIIEQIQEMEER